MDLSVRHLGPEIMDEGGLDYPEYLACMSDLSRVNAFTLAYLPTLAFLERLRREGRLPEGRPLEVLDVGFGYGDMLRSIDRWARRRRVPVALTGGLFTRDPRTVTRVATRSPVGNLYVNRAITGAMVGRQPFGGNRLSGTGTKAGGAEYLLQFVAEQVVSEETVRHGLVL